MEFEFNEEWAIDSMDSLESQENIQQNIRKGPNVFVDFNENFEKNHLRFVLNVFILDSIPFIDIKSGIKPCGVLFAYGLTNTGLLPSKRRNNRLKSPEMVLIYYNSLTHSLFLRIPPILTLGEFPYYFCDSFIRLFEKSTHFYVFSLQKNKKRLNEGFLNPLIYYVSTRKLAAPFRALSSETPVTALPAQVMTFCRAYGYAATAFFPDFLDALSFPEYYENLKSLLGVNYWQLLESTITVSQEPKQSISLFT
ncbi:hypothetical protein MXB_2523 [Myxobolus squamalis]|nr:hypothetical protein MXB_2523 [Myxobolus squamalis]